MQILRSSPAAAGNRDRAVRFSFLIKFRSGLESLAPMKPARRSSGGSSRSSLRMGLLWSSCLFFTAACGPTYAGEALELNRVRRADEQAVRYAEQSEKHAGALASENAALREVVGSLATEVEKAESEATACHAKMMHLGVKTELPFKQAPSGSLPSAEVPAPSH
ncbi:MAG: hypothetical protein KDD69_08480 [Bdellovibrionales bacterium]|nr:hypothetical protein [Bdellovibrionales bacterium]